jgi:aminoglycoside 6'-N-acetyltransferase I
MKLFIREMAAADHPAWVKMRGALWPEESRQSHARAINSFVGNRNAWGFIAETPDGTAVGFAEVAIRAHANGCDSQPVPFLEGIWVKAPDRRKGVGCGLIQHVELFLAARGFGELGSDTQIDNHTSQAAHLSWGFAETERVVYFRKRLGGPRRQMAGRRPSSGDSIGRFGSTCTTRPRHARIEYLMRPIANGRNAKFRFSYSGDPGSRQKRRGAPFLSVGEVLDSAKNEWAMARRRKRWLATTSPAQRIVGATSRKTPIQQKPSGRPQMRDRKEFPKRHQNTLRASAAPTSAAPIPSTLERTT